MSEPDRQTVVLIDDDPLFLRTLAINLQDSGFQVESYGNGVAALAGLSAGAAPAAMILDWQMPGLDGIEVLRRLRLAGIASPAIFLTGLNQPMYEELALEQGAVDFVDKTRSFSVILKRLQLALGGAKALTPAVEDGVAIQAGKLTLKPETKRAQWDGHEVPLSLGEYEVVAYLAKRAGNDISYREIYDLVRGHGFAAGDGAEGYRANVRAMIKRIRKKFADIEPHFDVLENYPGFGYRWRNGHT